METLIFDNVTHRLSSDNYIPIVTDKKYIIIGNSFNHDMKHVSGWKKRYNGLYTKTAAFTIANNGVIYNHFDSKYYSNYFKNKDLNKSSIIILLENDGWLTKDVEKNDFLTWYGDIYKEKELIFEKKWRGFNYWSQYNDEQIKAITSLIKILCVEHNIPLSVVNHNTKIDKTIDYKNIMYKSNLDKKFTDVNPSWDCELLKNKLENNERTN